jgi:hypothetical protein
VYETEYNYLEAGIWTAFAIVIVRMARAKPPGHRRETYILAGTFAVFGVSDLIETQTGKWWDPWWLLAMKAACVTVILTIAVRVQRQKEVRRALTTKGKAD